MRKVLVLALLAILALSAVPFVSASPAAQFAGCADEVDEEYGARFRLLSLNGLDFQITAVGVDDFDPTITILDADGEVVTCNNDADGAAEVSVSLPSIMAGPSETTARAGTNVPGDEGRLDYEVIVGSNDGTSGEFVLMYSGAEVFGADNIDQFQLVSTDAMGEAEVPFAVYAVNLQRPDQALDPTVSVTFGEDFQQTCFKSSAASLCEGDHEDLRNDDYYVVLEGEEQLQMFGDDAMLNLGGLGGEGAEFGIAVGSYNANSFGPYTLIIHTGVSYPEAE